MTEPAAFAGFSPGMILLDKYRVVRELGFGGMSLVVCAEHVALRTKVALKFLLPEFASLPDASQRFLREAQAATRIQSEHVARVLDVGTLPDGPPYIVMEYLEGKDLGRHVKEGTRFAVPEALHIVVQVAEALSRAHAAGVVHRDVKPSNLFLTQRDDGSSVVKVLDFGISKVKEEAAKDNLELTKTTAVMGSALYMSLEQMRSTKTVDHRTDIYALGVSLYELLTGSHPFTAESFSELCVKVSLDPPVPLRALRPDVPEALAAAIAVAYARAPEERYQSAGQMAVALAKFGAPETKALADSIRRAERVSYPDLADPVRPSHPPPLSWALYAAVLGGGLALAAAVWVGWNPIHGGGTSGGVTLTDAAAEAGDATPDAAVLDAAVTDASAAPDADVEVALDAGVTRPDAGASKPPADPCAGKPRGTLVRMPNGLMRNCGL